MNDLINRQDAIRLAEQGQIRGFAWQFKKLCTLPSAEPEHKKGEWIFIHPLQVDDKGAYICSNCHRGDWDIKPTDKYCKFCGADMRGEQDDTD